MSRRTTRDLRKAALELRGLEMLDAKDLSRSGALSRAALAVSASECHW